MANDTTTTNGTTTAQSATASPTSAALAPTSTAAADDAGSGRAMSPFASGANFDPALRMAKALASSSLVPDAYRGSLPNVLIALELANRIGASVFAVMQNLDIINGRPSWRATFLIATVNACGRFTPLRFRWSGKEGTDDWGCRCVAKDRETGEECIGALITIGLAKTEGWTTKKGSKWVTMPEQMCMYRAAAFWTRVYAPEQSLGMQTSDELQDMADIGVLPAPMPPALAPGSPKALEAELMGAGEPASGKVETTREVPPAADSKPSVPDLESASVSARVAARVKARQTPDYDPMTGEVLSPTGAESE